MLAADDPKLAARLAAFGQPGIGQVLRTRRARATMSVMMLALIAAVAAVIYMMSALRTGTGFPGHGQHSGQPTAQPSTRVATKPAVGGATNSAIRASHARQAGEYGVCAPGSTTACGRFVPDGRPHVQAPQPTHHQ